MVIRKRPELHWSSPFKELDLQLKLRKDVWGFADGLSPIGATPANKVCKRSFQPGSKVAKEVM